MNFKMLSLVVVFAGFLLLGFLVWNKYKRRKMFFASFLNFCEHLTVEISFSKNTLSKIIQTYGAGYCAEFKKLINAYGELLDGKTDITPERIDGLINKTIIHQNEADAIVDFFVNLGRHGMHEEAQKIAAKRVIFAEFYAIANEQLRRDASTYLKLFIFMGIAVVILMI